jgi:2-dehydro-3-deoxy-D-arabinonate dehydratase
VSLKMLQYEGPNVTRSVLVSADRNQSVDVSSLAPDGFSSVVRQARLENLSLSAALNRLMERGGEEVDVDLDRGVVIRDGRAYPLTVPLPVPEVWAAGVTYMQSRTAREYESGVANRAVYARVYEADRPEVFLKDVDCRRTVGPGGEIYVRGDSSWTVPEPELALVVNSSGAIVAYTIGNDVSARDIEAENPLYLPQAKIYRNSCALGPTALVVDPEKNDQYEFGIELRILDAGGNLLFKGETSTSQMKRPFDELVDYLARYNVIEDGTVLLTGTGVVPPDDFSLDDGQLVEIEVSEIGTLRNPVRKLTAK